MGKNPTLPLVFFNQSFVRARGDTAAVEVLRVLRQREPGQRRWRHVRREVL